MHSLRVAFRDFPARIAIAAGLCVVMMAGGVFMVNRYIDGKIDDIPRVDVAVAPQSGDAVNFVIVGSDTRSFIKNQTQFDAFSDDATQSAPPRSDTLMVLHADGDRSYAVSFPRDLWVEVPGLGHAKINAAFNDGAQSVVDTLSTDFGLDLNHYLEVDFETFQQLVDAIGTVPVYFPTAARDEFTGLNVWVAGCYRLDGPAALSYVRSCDLKYLNTATGKWENASPRGDLDRIARQQAFIKKLGRIAMDRVTGNPTIAPDVVDATIPNLKADTAFDRGAFNALACALLGLSTGDGTGLQFDTIPAEPASRDSQAVLLVKQGEADPMLARLRGEADVPPPATGDGSGAVGAQRRALAGQRARAGPQRLGRAGPGRGGGERVGPFRLRQRRAEQLPEDRGEDPGALFAGR